MKHSIAKYIEDVRLSISDILNYVHEVSSWQQIKENQLLFDALCRRFAIIGEAIYQANKLDENLPITDKNKIIGLRHILVHDYDLIRAADLWKIIEKQIPVLKGEIENLLKNLNEHGPTKY